MECSGGSSDFVIPNPLKVRGAQQRRKIKPEEQGKSMGMGSVDAISDGRNPEIQLVTESGEGIHNLPVARTNKEGEEAPRIACLHLPVCNWWEC